MSSCGFKTLVSTPGGPSKYPKHSKESVIIRNCCKDIKGHLRSLNTFDSDLKSEGKLILDRAGPPTIKVEREERPWERGCMKYMIHYYSTIMSFYQIRSREEAKYEALIHFSVLF